MAQGAGILDLAPVWNFRLGPANDDEMTMIFSVHPTTSVDNDLHHPPLYTGINGFYAAANSTESIAKINTTASSTLHNLRALEHC